MKRDKPLVRAIVVDYGGGELTLRCLRSVLNTDWPATSLDVVLVDNASPHSVATDVERELPRVRVIRSPQNVGFAGGCNLGLRNLADTDFVALVNNDAIVDPGWLEPLIDAMTLDARLGATCPKILFDSRYVEIGLDVPTHRRGRGDSRDLGVRLSGARVAQSDVWTRVQLVHGFWGFEPAPMGEDGAQWTQSSARLRVPLTEPAGPRAGSLRLAGETGSRVTLSCGDATATHTVSSEPDWYDIELAAEAQHVINNVGTVVRNDGYAMNRGYLHPDDGQFDEPAYVDAWCGAGVLLRRGYLDDVGPFDERLFLYYEDVDLSLRGRAKGWRYRYIPGSIVRHVHAASSIEGSAFKQRHDERNRLLVLARHAGPTRAARQLVPYLMATGSYARRDMLTPILLGRAPHGEIVVCRLGALAGFARELPAILASRRRDVAERAAVEGGSAMRTR
jgi:GT2 family glycosyltransferase